jgi:hypothetical protein
MTPDNPHQCKNSWTLLYLKDCVVKQHLPRIGVFGLLRIEQCKDCGYVRVGFKRWYNS